MHVHMHTRTPAPAYPCPTAHTHTRPRAYMSARRAVAPVTVYTLDQLPPFDGPFYEKLRETMQQVDSFVVAPRDAEVFEVPAGHLFSINSVEGPQVGDLNLWIAPDHTEH